MDKFYKLARPDGWDFYTGKTINYRENVGKIVKCPKFDKQGDLCSTAFIHASRNPNQCFVGAKIPCSAYLVKGKPIKEDKEKCGFGELIIEKELVPKDLFEWDYETACNPINPFKISPPIIGEKEKKLLKDWDSVRASVGASVRDSVGAYAGKIFENCVKKWKYIDHKPGIYPFQPAVDLWNLGLVPSFDGKIGRLHGGKKAQILYKMKK